MTSPDIDFDAARREARNIGWTKTAAQLGVGVDWLRRRADPLYAYYRDDPAIQFIHGKRDSVPSADAARALAQIPPDTRTPMERLMGIPLKGRSALDQHRVEEDGERAPVAPRLPYVRFLDPKMQRVRT